MSRELRHLGVIEYILKGNPTVLGPYDASNDHRLRKVLLSLLSRFFDLCEGPRAENTSEYWSSVGVQLKCAIEMLFIEVAECAGSPPHLSRAYSFSQWANDVKYTQLGKTRAWNTLLQLFYSDRAHLCEFFSSHSMYGSSIDSRSLARLSSFGNRFFSFLHHIITSMFNYIDVETGPNSSRRRTLYIISSGRSESRSSTGSESFSRSGTHRREEMDVPYGIDMGSTDRDSKPFGASASASSQPRMEYGSFASMTYNMSVPSHPGMTGSVLDPSHGRSEEPRDHMFDMPMFKPKGDSGDDSDKKDKGKKRCFGQICLQDVEIVDKPQYSSSSSVEEDKNDGTGAKKEEKKKWGLFGLLRKCGTTDKEILEQQLIAKKGESEYLLSAKDDKIDGHDGDDDQVDITKPVGSGPVLHSPEVKPGPELPLQSSKSTVPHGKHVGEVDYGSFGPPVLPFPDIPKDSIEGQHSTLTSTPWGSSGAFFPPFKSSMTQSGEGGSTHNLTQHPSSSMHHFTGVRIPNPMLGDGFPSNPSTMMPDYWGDPRQHPLTSHGHPSYGLTHRSTYISDSAHTDPSIAHSDSTLSFLDEDSFTQPSAGEGMRANPDRSHGYADKSRFPQHPLQQHYYSGSSHMPQVPTGMHGMAHNPYGHAAYSRPWARDPMNYRYPGHVPYPHRGMEQDTVAPMGRYDSASSLSGMKAPIPGGVSLTSDHGDSLHHSGDTPRGSDGHPPRGSFPQNGRDSKPRLLASLSVDVFLKSDFQRRIRNSFAHGIGDAMNLLVRMCGRRVHGSISMTLDGSLRAVNDVNLNNGIVVLCPGKTSGRNAPRHALLHYTYSLSSQLREKLKYKGGSSGSKGNDDESSESSTHVQSHSISSDHPSHSTSIVDQHTHGKRDALSFGDVFVCVIVDGVLGEEEMTQARQVLNVPGKIPIVISHSGVVK
ncbi:hypothetical protein ADUPG1_008278, partial [Aduncisulcus paluster]